jgi:branched-chain amino acid transport system substrate-binding protein
VPTATIKIVTHGPMSGFLAAGWTNLVHAVELALAQAAPSFEALGFKIELVTYDDQDDMSVAVGNAKEIVADPEILCGVGHYTSRIFRQTQDLYHRAGLAFIGPSTTAPTVTEFEYPEINRLLGRDDFQGPAGAMFAEAQGMKRAFVIGQTNPLAQANASYFRSEAGRRGIDVVASMKTDAMTGFEAAVEAVLATQAEVVYFSTFSPDQAGAFFREAREAGYQGVFLGYDGMNSPALVTAAGPLAIEGGGLFYTATGAEPQHYPEAAEFVSDYQLRFGEDPQMWAAQAYDAARVCLNAVREAAAAIGGAVPTRAEVASAVRATRGFDGITGTITFNANGELDPARYFVFRVDSVDPGDWSRNAMVAFYDLAPPE